MAKDCDPWYEPESEWHRSWKELFPPQWREVVIGPHRADLKTPLGVVEFQSSCISPAEIEERELFYGKMIWVVKADTFIFEHRMSSRARNACSKVMSPAPKHPALKDKCNLLDLLGCGKYVSKADLDDYDCKYQEWSKMARQIENKYWEIYPSYRWLWPRKSWQFAKRKIYLDRGDHLFRIDWMSTDCRFIEGKLYKKEDFVRKLLAKA